MASSQIQVLEKDDQGTLLLEIGRRGRVICLPDGVYIVPEPALVLLQSLGVNFTEMGRG